MANKQFETITGKTLYDSSGEKIGTIKELYLDESNETPSWVTVSSGIFGTKQHFMPLDGVIEHEDGLMSPFSKATILNAPRITAGDNLEEADEGRLLSHYSSAGESNRGSEKDREGSHDNATGEREGQGTGKLRLRRYIVTETQQVEVPVQREVIEVETEGASSSDTHHQENRDRARKDPAFGEVRNPNNEEERSD